MRRIKSGMLCVLMLAVFVGCGKAEESVTDFDKDSVITDSEAADSLLDEDLFTECGIEDLEWVQYESDWEDIGQSASDSAENQNDMETIFVNRHGDVFNSEGDTAGIMATLKAFEWLVPRSSGECIADNLSAEENEFITESNKVLNGSEEAEDRVWIRIVQNSALQTEGSTIPHKDFIFYVVGDDAYVGIQSPEANDSWAIWKMPDYGDWLAKEIDIYIRMTTGL